MAQLPIVPPMNYLMEMDPTHVIKHDDRFKSYPWYTKLGQRMGRYHDDKLDPFDFYEDALGG